MPVFLSFTTGNLSDLGKQFNWVCVKDVDNFINMLSTKAVKADKLLSHISSKNANALKKAPTVAATVGHTEAPNEASPDKVKSASNTPKERILGKKHKHSPSRNQGKRVLVFKPSPIRMGPLEMSRLMPQNMLCDNIMDHVANQLVESSEEGDIAVMPVSAYQIKDSGLKSGMDHFLDFLVPRKWPKRLIVQVNPGASHWSMFEVIRDGDKRFVIYHDGIPNKDRADSLTKQLVGRLARLEKAKGLAQSKWQCSIYKRKAIQRDCYSCGLVALLTLESIVYDTVFEVIPSETQFDALRTLIAKNIMHGTSIRDGALALAVANCTDVRRYWINRHNNTVDLIDEDDDDFEEAIELTKGKPKEQVRTIIFVLP